MSGSELDRLRTEIEALDARILDAIAERTETARRIGEVKKAAGSATLDPEREATVIRRAVAAGRERGLPTEPVRQLFWTLLDLCRTEQLEER